MPKITLTPPTHRTATEALPMAASGKDTRSLPKGEHAMHINLRIVVDLGELGTEAEQLADADDLVRAIAEVLSWRGHVKYFNAGDDLCRWGYDRDGGLRHGTKQLVLAGVEWGGK